MNNKTIRDLRVDYSLKKFDESELIKDPYKQFSTWLHEAITAEVNEPNAMTLATVKPDGTPSARIVLLKEIQEDGLVFFTNYESNKAQQIENNNTVAIVFCWLELQRQVRIEGIARKISDADSDAYFHTRPTNSQIGAHASPQSKVIENRDTLENAYRNFEELFKKEPIIRPVNWGGYIIQPRLFEFWQGRESRLHDRFRFVKTNNEHWTINRLAP